MNSWRLWLGRILNIGLLAIVILQVVSYFQRSKIAGEAEGTKLQSVELISLKGETELVPFDTEKRAIIFWASWCGPCKLDLYRINQSVITGEIPRSAILAVALEDDIDAVAETVAQREYQFPVLVDQMGKLARQIRVPATPTLALVDGAIVKDVSVGVSVMPTKWIRDFLAL